MQTTRRSQPDPSACKKRVKFSSDYEGFECLHSLGLGLEWKEAVRRKYHLTEIISQGLGEEIVRAKCLIKEREVVIKKITGFNHSKYATIQLLREISVMEHLQIA